MRNEIDNLLVQRSQFNESYKALMARLDDSKRTMMDLIEQATVAYEQRYIVENRTGVHCDNYYYYNFIVVNLL